MVGEVFAGLGAFKAMFDAAKALKDMNDAAIRNGAVIELQEQILTAQLAQSELIEKVRALEKEVADLKTKEIKKQRYELKNLGFGAFTYMLKKEARGTEPPHWVCAHCYENGEIFILQYTVHQVGTKMARRGWFCPSCHNEIETADAVVVRWLD